MRKKFLSAGFLGLVLFWMLFVMFPQDSQAIPPFARKYKTSCTTCHWSTFPKLNAFGRAFRANGLRMPGGGDEVFVKEEPVAMGAPAWSKLFPNAIWPGEIPGLPPITVGMSSGFKYLRERPTTPMGSGDGRRDSQRDSFFEGISAISLLTSGTLGETISWFGSMVFFENSGFGGSTTNIDRIYFNYAPFVFGEQGLVNIRFGQFEPRVVPVSNHRRQLRLTGYLMDVLPVVPAGNFFGFAPNQKGVEIWGSMNGPGGKGGLEWAIGVVNGQPGGALEVFTGAVGASGTIAGNVDGQHDGKFDVNNGKDWYATVSYKIGGMGVLGEESVDSSLVAKENWQDNQVTIKGYYYQGTTGAFVDSPTVPMGNALNGLGWNRDANRFRRYGVVVDANWWNFNFIGAASFMEDDLTGTTTFGAMGTMPMETGDKFYVDIYTGEIQYVALPWFVPSYRFENVNPDYDVRSLKSFNRHSFDISIIARANMKFLAGATFSSYPDERSGVGGDIVTPDLPPLDDMVRVGVDIIF